MKSVIWTLVCVVGLYAGTASASPAAQTTAAGKVPDATLDKRIEQRVKSDATLKRFDIDVAVTDGVVTLSGKVATQAQKARALRLAQVSGVTRVDNQIAIDASATKGTVGTIKDKTSEGAGKVGEKAKEGYEKTKEGAKTAAEKTKEGAVKVADKTKEGLGKAGDEITDAWIITRVKSKFLDESLLKGSDINVDSDNHIVTLRGTVTTAAARARAVEEAKKVQGVKSVVDRLTIAPAK